MQTLITTSVRYDILCVLTLITHKLQVVYGRSTYWMTALLLKMCISCVRAGCKIWLVNYGSKNALQSLSDNPFVHTYTHNLKLCVIYERSAYWTTALLLKTFLTGELWPYIHISRSLAQNCVCVLQVCIFITIWCTTMHDNKTHITYNCTLHTKMLYCQRCIIL